MTGTPYFFGGKPLIRGGKPAMDEACCCVDECCCGPCIRFRFEVSGVADGGTCAACADTNGTWITPPIFPTIADGVCTYGPIGIPALGDPNPLDPCQTPPAFVLSARIDCPVDGKIRLQAVANFSIIIVDPEEPDPGGHFNLDESYDDCSEIDGIELIRSAAISLDCDLSDASVTVSVIGCDDIQGRQVTGTSTLEGTLTAFANAEGDSEGASSLEGDLSAIGNRSGFVTARSTVQGRIDGDFEMAGSVTAASFVDGTLSAVGSRSGEVSGVSVVDGTLLALVAMQAEASATSSLTGTISSLVSAFGGVSGVSLLDGSLVAFAAISGDVEGTSVTSGNATALGSLSGAAKASSKLTGRIDGDVALSGQVQAASVLGGTLTALVATEGAATASSTLTASIASIVSSSGAITATSTADGLLVAFYLVSGDVSGTSTVTGTLTALGSLEGSVSASSKLTGRVAGDVDLSGSVTGTSTVQGTLSALAFFSQETIATSATDSDLSALAFFSQESISTSSLTGELESCCCGDCIVFRYTISGLANGFCSTCDDYNTDNDSPPVYQSEDCVYSAQWESSDCDGVKIVFRAELICDDDGLISLSGTIQDTSIGPIPLEGPPEEGPAPTNEIMIGSDTFEIGTPCNELEVALTRDVGLQGVCDFDSATVVLKVVDCPQNEAVIKKLTRKAKKRKARRVRKPKVELPICQHRGEELGKADCQCAGKPMVWHCTLLDQPCIAQTVGKPITKAGDKRISSPVACSLCDYFEATGSR